MLTHPTLDLMDELGLAGMAAAFKDLANQPEARALEHGDWLALLLEREATQRRQTRLERRLRAARLRHDAQVEDVDFRTARGLDRGMLLKLAGCDWVRQRRGLLLTGPAGVGKSWLACALGHKACREDFSVLYHRAPRLFAALGQARENGRYERLLKSLARIDLLILDDWGPEKLTGEQRRDLLEIVEERYERRSTIVTSQVPVDRWYEIIGNPTIADAVLTGSSTTPGASSSAARACENKKPSRPPKRRRLDLRRVNGQTTNRPGRKTRNRPASNRNACRLEIGTGAGFVPGINCRLHRNTHGMGEGDDVAWLTIYLASRAARYVTGQCIAVDGGVLVS